jgi:hypothetical protein
MRTRRRELEFAKEVPLKAFGKLQFFAVLALTLVLSPALGLAQDYHGKFTLPFEAKWGSAVLPAGDYTLSLRQGYATEGYAVFLRGEGKNAIILPVTTTNPKEESSHSKLILVDTGGRYAVRSFEVAELGLTFEYRIAKSGTKQMANQRGFMRHIPVSATAP